MASKITWKESTEVLVGRRSRAKKVPYMWKKTECGAHNQAANRWGIFLKQTHPAVAVQEKKADMKVPQNQPAMHHQ